MRLGFTYDAQSRRIAKRVWRGNVGNSEWVLRESWRFVYDGWNMIAEYEVPISNGAETAGAGGLTGCVLRRSYHWGLDLSQTLTGAGGVGGLLALHTHDSASGSAAANATYLPCYEANGNITELVSWTNTSIVCARYEYGPFGETVLLEGVEIARENPFRFSTKFHDQETGFLYYGYRYYIPALGRWLNRDPIGERGGINLYGMVGNDPINRIDFLGLAEVQKRDCRYTVYIGHTHHVRKQYDQDHKRPGDKACGVSCYSSQLNGPQGPFGNNVIPESPGVPRYLYPDPQKRPEGYPDYDPEKDGDLDDYAFGSIANAERQAETECGNKETCCKSIEVKVTCSRGGATEAAMHEGGWASYENLGTSSGAYKNPCNYRNTFDCKTKKWSGPRIDHWQTAYPTSPAKP